MRARVNTHFARLYPDSADSSPRDDQPHHVPTATAVASHPTRTPTMSTAANQTEDDTATELLKRIANGDEKAMELFYNTFSRVVYAFVLKRIRNAVEAEELVVETMYQAWRHAGSFEGRSRPRTWLLGIALHRALDKVRVMKADRFEPLGEEIDSMPSEDLTAFDQIANAQLKAQLKVCMDVLPVEQRECIHLAFYEDLSLAEIAEIQDCPVNTVKTRLFHARRKLKIEVERRMRWKMQS